MDGNIPDTPPVVAVPNEEDRPRWEQFDTLRRDLRKKLVDRPRRERDPAFEPGCVHRRAQGG
jgi:hypothetical protein